ncbi:unnamed protein product, partial [Prorocentrum cordatum]
MESHSALRCRQRVGAPPPGLAAGCPAALASRPAAGHAAAAAVRAGGSARWLPAIAPAAGPAGGRAAGCLAAAAAAYGAALDAAEVAAAAGLWLAVAAGTWAAELAFRAAGAPQAAAAGRGWLGEPLQAEASLPAAGAAGLAVPPSGLAPPAAGLRWQAVTAACAGAASAAAAAVARATALSLAAAAAAAAGAAAGAAAAAVAVDASAECGPAAVSALADAAAAPARGSGIAAADELAEPPRRAAERLAAAKRQEVRNVSGGTCDMDGEEGDKEVAMEEKGGVDMKEAAHAVVEVGVNRGFDEGRDGDAKRTEKDDEEGCLDPDVSDQYLPGDSVPDPKGQGELALRRPVANGRFAPLRPASPDRDGSGLVEHCGGGRAHGGGESPASEVAPVGPWGRVNESLILAFLSEHSLSSGRLRLAEPLMRSVQSVATGRETAVGPREELRAELLVVQGGWRLAQEAAQERRLTVADSAMASFWLLLCGALAMAILAGIAMLGAGGACLKNAPIALVKHIVCVYVVKPGWLLFGWALACGVDDAAARAASAGGGFVGADGRLSAMCAVCTFMCALLYHVVVARICGCDWTGALIDFWSIDFAGSAVVHGAGSVSGLAGNIVLGPRGRCRERPNQLDEKGLPLVFLLLGTFIPWLGWRGFNCGPVLSVNQRSGSLAVQVAMGATAAASTGGISVFFWRRRVTRACDRGGLCGNILTGLVSIMAAWGNAGTGCELSLLAIDESVDPVPAHGFFHCLGVSPGALFDWVFFLIASAVGAAAAAGSTRVVAP